MSIKLYEVEPGFKDKGDMIDLLFLRSTDFFLSFQCLQQMDVKPTERKEAFWEMSLHIIIIFAN